MKIQLLGAVALLAGVSMFVACSDDADDGGGTGGTGATGASGSGASGATGATGGMGSGGMGTGGMCEPAMLADCDAACGQLYDCGVEDGNCPGFTGDAMEKETFVGGCLDGCMAMMALVSLIDSCDCSGTVTLISGASTDFEDSCQNGISGSGGGGGGM